MAGVGGSPRACSGACTCPCSGACRHDPIRSRWSCHREHHHQGRPVTVIHFGGRVGGSSTLQGRTPCLWLGRPHIHKAASTPLEFRCLHGHDKGMLRVRLRSWPLTFSLMSLPPFRREPMSMRILFCFKAQMSENFLPHKTKSLRLASAALVRSPLACVVRRIGRRQ